MNLSLLGLFISQQMFPKLIGDDDGRRYFSCFLLVSVSNWSAVTCVLFVKNKIRSGEITDASS